MDDELQQLEAELTRLRPAAPSAHLRARLDRALALAAPVRPAAPLWWLWSGALPAAAALALMVMWGGRHDAGAGPRAASAPGTVGMTVAAPAFKPVAAENVLYASGDDGIITLADGTAARRERLSYVDTIVWRDPRTNASVRWSVPREEIRVVPVNFQ
jgi:hypothetical protein